MTNARRLAAGSLAWIVTTTAAHAQEGTQCNFQSNNPVQVLRTEGAPSSTFTGGGVVVRCPARRITLRADSLEFYGGDRRIFLIGSVDYDEPRLKLTSDRLTYYVPEERVVAVGRVNALLPSGSRLTGPQAEYRRAAPGIRQVAEMTAIGRPSVTLVEGRSGARDTAGTRRTTSDTTRPPTIVTANTIFVRGDSLIYGSGNVDIRRPDLTAASDSLFLDTGREFMRLLRQPRIEGKRDRPYSLSGVVIDVQSRSRQLERVVAKGRGTAVSQDMTLTADTIDLRVASDLLQHAVAWGPGGARAVSPTQTITADSITAAMPGQRVRTVTASRGALAEARPDSTRIETDENDWLRGDTIVAQFDTAAVARLDTAATARRDTTQQPQIRFLVATGDARSYYHLPPSDSTLRAPAINYVTGENITVAFDSQRVAQVTVVGQKSGLYLEPVRDSVSARSSNDRRAATPRSTSGQSPQAPARPPAPTARPIRPISRRQ